MTWACVVVKEKKNACVGTVFLMKRECRLAAKEGRFQPGMKFVMLSQQNSSPLNRGEIVYVIAFQPCIIICVKRYKNC